MSNRGTMNSQMPSVKRHGVSLPPPLEKCANSADENDYKAVIGPRIDPDRCVEASYISIQSLSNQILELQVRFSLAINLLCVFVPSNPSHYNCVWHSQMPLLINLTFTAVNSYSLLPNLMVLVWLGMTIYEKKGKLVDLISSRVKLVRSFLYYRCVEHLIGIRPNFGTVEKDQKALFWGRGSTLLRHVFLMGNRYFNMI